ncbi:hypothetical protein EWM64_g6179 [Hericium alpestre]|uniref:GH16 domain-containing protein n=1 Tax=Hericium alpestre TaxID=135208 RepID=A0A4Y9ZVD0_9AGAM|nr:hypothetical protein EWM64_g6179 [Hericium alpestre]
MVAAKSACALVLALLPTIASAQYNLVKQYQGSSFFDDWDFYNNFDNLTNGDAIFVSAQQASQDQLAFVNGAGNAIMKVDNTSQVAFNQKRNTIRISSKDRFAVGSVWVADMLHVPFGCSVWPAFWSQAPDWPTGGEIDTFEAVNQVTRNQMSLHTEPGCTVSNPVQSSTLQNSTDCSFQANNNEGCVVTNPSTNSYGAPFASAGGGMWVTEFAEKGVSIWFFSRADVPSSLQGNSSSLDTSTLGTPVGNFPSSSCSVDKFFEPQHLIFDITLCGAGNPATFTQTCTGVCYNDYVIGSPSNYDNAYFEVRSVNVFGTSQSVDIPVSSAASSVGARVGAVAMQLALLFGACLVTIL